jgi:hypothetical protein
MLRMPTELTNEQRRQLIDVQQAYAAWRGSREAARGHMRWLNRRGTDYLHHKIGQHERSFGPRSEKTEGRFQEHKAARERLKRTAARLKTMARVNRALRLNRVPLDAVRVLRALDDARLLGDDLFVIGTNALYAYEIQSGVLFDSSLLATGDFDLLWDAKDRLRLAVSKYAPDGVLGVLKTADPTYSSAGLYGFRAQNANGYMVDLFCPEHDPPPARLSPRDIDPIPTEGADWLAQAPKLATTVIGQDGLPAPIVCVDPRIFALHKLWLSKQRGRQPTSRPRDAQQAIAAAAVAAQYLNLKFDRRLSKRLPAALAAGIDRLKNARLE